MAYQPSAELGGIPAVILYRYVHDDDNIPLQTNHLRIKILTERGLIHANVQIRILPDFSSIRDIRARVVQPDGTATEFTGTILESSTFNSRRMKIVTKTLALPGARVGSIIEYAYTIYANKGAPDYVKNPERYVIGRDTVSSYSMTRWDVQESLPTRKARFVLTQLPKGKLTWTWRLPEQHQPPKRMPDGVELVLENVPAFTAEPWMPPESALKQWVRFYYTIGAPTREKFWEKVGRHYNESLDEFLGKSKKIQAEVTRLLAPGDTPEAKLRKLHDRVDQVPAREDGKQSKNSEEVLERGYSGSEQLNFLLIALARAAGLEAYSVRVAHRDAGFFNPISLDALQVDYSVVVVILNGQERYFNPMDGTCPYGMLPWYFSGDSALRVTPAGGAIVTLPRLKSSDSTLERVAELKLERDGTARGKIFASFAGQDGFVRRLAAIDSDEIGRRKQVEDELLSWLPPGSNIQNLVIGSWEEYDAPAKVWADVVIPNAATVAGQRLLLAPAIFQSTAVSFASPERIHPIFFRYPYEHTDRIRIDLPADTQVEALPEEIYEKGPGTAFRATFLQAEQKILLVRRLIVADSFLNKIHYQALRTFFARLRASDEARIVVR